MSDVFNIELKLDKDFIAALEKLKVKYGEIFERLNGFHNNNLDFTDFIDNFVDSATVADASIDSNSNSNTKDIRTLMSDMMKPHTKLLSFNKIFYEHKKKYGLEAAEKWLEEEYNGCFYMHDAASVSLMPYCFAYDLDGLVEKGLYFINNFKSRAAKHLTTFNDHVLEFISWTSNRTSGAVGLPSYLVYSWWFWWKDVQNGFYLKDPEYYRRQCFQKFCYDLNQPYLRVSECAFTNISIMDRPYLEEIFGGRIFPDGTMAIDHIEEILEHQKVFMEVVAEIRKECMMTFPVLTYSLLYKDGKFVDEEFARWCSKHNLLWMDSNFFVSGDVTSLSSCCRLRNGIEDNTFSYTLGAGGIETGSKGVITLNLNRIVQDWTRESEEELPLYITAIVNRVHKYLTAFNEIIWDSKNAGLLTIGINGFVEGAEYLGIPIDADSAEYQLYAKDILETIKNLNIAARTDRCKFNTEFVPAESLGVKNAK